MKIRLLCCAAVLAAGTANAATPSYVTADRINANLILPAPPASDSETTRAELSELHRVEATRTAAQVARAQADDVNETMFLYRDVLGERFTPENLPLTAALSAHVKQQEPVVALPAKAAFQRVRPYNLDKTLHPVCKTKLKNDSYPSGHTTAGYLAALALVDLVPEKREQILRRAAEYRHNRVVCGVHYPSDVEASKLVAYATHAAMAGSPAYQQEVAAARAELRKALGMDD